MNKFLKWLGAFVVVAATAFVSGYAALAGAMLGGLKEGGWNLQFLSPLFCGWLGGFVLAVICLAVATFRSENFPLRLIITFFTPMLLAFGLATAIYSLSLRSERKSQQQFEKILTDIKNRPEAIHSLIIQAKQRTLSNNERSVLWQMLWTRQPISDDEISILLDYFEQDASALAGIMTNQTITAEQLRYLYDNHKSSREYSRVLDELTTHPLTPPDVLKSLTESPTHSLAEKAKERLTIEPTN